MEAGIRPRRVLVSSGVLVAPTTAPTCSPIALIMLATAAVVSGDWSSVASGFEVLHRAKTPRFSLRKGSIDERPMYGEQVMKSAPIAAAPLA